MSLLLHKTTNLFGRQLGTSHGLILADWCASPDFKAAVHQQAFEPSEVLDVAAIGEVFIDNMPLVEERVAKINARARKLGVEPVVTRIIKDETRIVSREGKLARAQRILTVCLAGRQPVMPGGWKLAAIVDFRQSIPLVTSVPGAELTIDPREHGSGCDHCKTARNRAEVFVLQGVDGNTTFVGRNCMSDFLGVVSSDPTFALSFFGSLGSVLSEEFPHGSRGDDGFTTRSVLALSAAIVNVSGWISRETSNNTGKPSTSMMVSSYINPPRFTPRQAKAEAEYREWRAQVDAQMEGDKMDVIQAEVDAALAWAKANRSNEFEAQLSDIAQCDYLGSRYFGRAVWIVPGFRLSQERLQRAERRKNIFADSKFIGEVGKRMSCELELISVKNFTTDYGISTLAIFNDGNGNQVKWFASNFPEWRVGEKRQVKLTVKKHEEYNGTKQTAVVRVA